MNCITLVLIFGFVSKVTGTKDLLDFMAITVATEENEMLKTFLNSSKAQNLNFTVRNGFEIINLNI